MKARAGTNNPTGNVYANSEDDFAMFDKLPKAAREALTDNPENYHSYAVLQEGRRNGYDVREYVLTIEQINKGVTEMAARRNYGPGHPQADYECRWPSNPKPRNPDVVARRTKREGYRARRTILLDTRLTHL